LCTTGLAISTSLAINFLNSKKKFQQSNENKKDEASAASSTAARINVYTRKPRKISTEMEKLVEASLPTDKVFACLLFFSFFFFFLTSNMSRHVCKYSFFSKTARVKRAKARWQPKS